ncbi:haloacid dehalogenase type II [Sphingomonas sp. CROZ-RG-20F-R02-07]|uniref:haloacid dehalogenase type II n=1 Tax=Sphingomonas sp. CROZ-RG-20F-R02-07 TaxID=2914832 RepID=UPI001F57FEFD|nr:haloacid dehalogenase type II [Sphingomonas sp. CROZ-RG-20F-R02-07]
MPNPRVLAFDVFGTVVDWRSGIIRESQRHLATIGRPDIDAAAFADAWRSHYQPAMAAVRDGKRTFVILDVLHRETLEAVLADRDVDVQAIEAALLEDWTRAWHRLDPWPDAVEGLTRLKARFPIVTLSNGNIALMLNMARRAGLPWDAILGAEVTRTYKPSAEAYTTTAAILDILPGELCLVAAHHSDLGAARGAGLLTAYVDRPMERGGAPAPDRDQQEAWEWQTDSLITLAEQLGC